MARVMLILAVTVTFLATGLSVPAEAVTPMEEVRTSVDAIFAVLRDADLPLQEKKDKVGALARARFDFRVMSQGVLATNWKKASAAEKERFVELFRSWDGDERTIPFSSVTQESVRLRSSKGSPSGCSARTCPPF